MNDYNINTKVNYHYYYILLIKMHHLKLTKCTTRTCSRCDIVYIIMKYINPLLQCLSNDIKEYNMQLITTKCLNTAVSLMFFLLGNKGVELATYCNSNTVVERHKAGNDNNTDVMRKIKKIILNKAIKNRYVYYILFNDGYFPIVTDGKESTVYFPGHVFLIERSSDENGSYYNFYQSYINQYDLMGYYDKKKSFKYSVDDTRDIILKLEYILKADSWDDKCIQYWKEFTHVDTTSIKGSNHKGHLFVCFTYDKIKVCVENINHYVAEKLSLLKDLAVTKPNDVYGEKRNYDSDITPLTNKEMYKQLEFILKDISLNKNTL